MSFTSKQRRSLATKLKHQHVKRRSSQGATISYLEGWHVIAEANRIFGFDCWDRKTLTPRCVWSERQGRQLAAFYSTKVRITVRAGGELVLREGIGTGFARAASAEAAHEMALKAAETDATKRALATFGNPFGLALYDKEQAGVTRPPVPAPFILSSLGARLL
jgi:DNA recombination protein Rad52